MTMERTEIVDNYYIYFGPKIRQFIDEKQRKQKEKAQLNYAIIVAF